MEINKEQFNNWNIKKQELHFTDTKQKVYFKEGQVWWCSLGQNIGSEALGKGEHFRCPVLILKKLSKSTCIALPLSTQEKTGSWFTEITLQGEKRWVLLYQIKMIDKKRFQYKLGELDDTDFIQVKEKLEALLELSSNHHQSKSSGSMGNPKSNISIKDTKK